MSRFESVIYDANSQLLYEEAIRRANHLVELIESLRGRSEPDSESQSIALFKLDEVMLWTGRAILDDQSKGYEDGRRSGRSWAKEG